MSVHSLGFIGAKNDMMKISRETPVTLHARSSGILFCLLPGLTNNFIQSITHSLVHPSYQIFTVRLLCVTHWARCRWSSRETALKSLPPTQRRERGKRTCFLHQKSDFLHSQSPQLISGPTVHSALWDGCRCLGWPGPALRHRLPTPDLWPLSRGLVLTGWRGFSSPVAKPTGHRLVARMCLVNWDAG